MIWGLRREIQLQSSPGESITCIPVETREGVRVAISHHFHRKWRKIFSRKIGRESLARVLPCWAGDDQVPLMMRAITTTTYRARLVWANEIAGSEPKLTFPEQKTSSLHRFFPPLFLLFFLMGPRSHVLASSDASLLDVGTRAEMTDFIWSREKPYEIRLNLRDSRFPDPLAPSPHEKRTGSIA